MINNFHDVWFGEKPPKRRNIIWLHHSTVNDLNSPIVMSVFSNGKWVDVNSSKDQAQISGKGVKSIVNIDKEDFDALSVKDPETIYIVKNDPTNGHEWVDMGSVDDEGYHIIWATKNIGAENPWDAGKYFAWADTVGYYADEGHAFSQENAAYWDSQNEEYTKYNEEDGLTELQPEDDAAHVQWCGLWQMPNPVHLQKIIEDYPVTIQSHGNSVYALYQINNINLIIPFAGYNNSEEFNNKFDILSKNLSDNSNHQYLCAIQYDFEIDAIYLDTVGRDCGMTIRPIIKVKDLSELDPTYDIYLGENKIVDNSLSDYDKSILDPGEDQYAYGVLIDFTQGKSSYDLTRIGNMDLHRELPVQSQYRGCIWDLNTQSIVTYLNPDNWNLGNEDYTAEELADLIEDNSSYSIRVETPKFYARSKVLAVDGAGNTMMAKVMFSTQKLNPLYIEVPRMVIDFRPIRINADVYPISSTRTEETWGGYCTTKNSPNSSNGGLFHPITNIDRGAMRNIASNSDTHIFSYEAYKWIFYWAFVIEYATLFTAKPMIQELDENGFHQGGLGPGMTSIESYGAKYSNDSYIYNEDYDIQDSFYLGANYFRSDDSDEFPLRDIGVTNNWGNRTGENIVEYTRNGKTSHVHQNRYRGFEFPFGDIMMNLDGFLGYTFMDDNNAPIAEAYFTCSNPEKFQDTLPSEYDGNDFDNGWRLALWNDKLDSFHREGYDEGAAKAMCIGNNGDLFATKWFVGEGYKFDKYFVNYNYPPDGSQNTTLLVGSYAHSNGLFLVGLGYLSSDSGVAAADSIGFRCFNIIED